MRNGSGTYSLPNPAVVPNTTISSVVYNGNNSDIAIALTGSIASDGQTPISGSIKFTNGASNSPSITTVGDTGTGFYFNTAAHQLSWAYNGVAGGTFNNDAAGGVSFGANISVAGNATITGNETLTGTLTVTGASALNGGASFGGTTGITVPNGTTAQRPGTPVDGVFRFNTSTNQFEGWNGVSWITISLAPRGYIDGLTLSKASATSIGIAAGTCRSDDNTTDIVLSLPFTKTTAVWTIGNGGGGLDTGVIAASTWYYVYAIYDPTTGASDIVYTATNGAPTLPTGYTEKRYIGAVKTDGTPNFISFTQAGDYFKWVTPTLDFSSTTVTTASQTIALSSVPTAISVRADMNIATGTSVGAYVYIRNPNDTDMTPSNSVAPLGTSGNNTPQTTDSFVSVWTDTTGSVAARASAANTFLDISVVGWIDQRGRNL